VEVDEREAAWGRAGGVSGGGGGGGGGGERRGARARGAAHLAPASSPPALSIISM
jgi:hypothetical protein